MNPAALTIQPETDLALTPDEQALICCELAREQKEIGNYEAACAALKQWWRIGARPVLHGLDQRAAAEVLLRAGALSGWVGSTQQLPGAAEMAKSLLSGSIAIFELLGEEARAAEGQIELAYCYYREGAFDEARGALRAALERLPLANNDLRALALLRRAIVERQAARLNDALTLLTEAAPLIETVADHSLRGRFHNELATTLKDLGAAEQRPDYMDRALVEYAEASYHFAQIGHTRFHAVVENNLGFLFFMLGRFEEASEHLGHARQLFVSLRDDAHRAQVDETRTRLLLAEKKYAEAEAVIRPAVETLEASGQQALLAEALTTQGLVLARLGRHHEARPALERARQVAERCGDREGAGRALLTLIEEECDLLSDTDRREAWMRADQLLATSQHAETLARLRSCEQLVAAAHAEHERRREEEAQKEKLAALGKLAFGIAHDFNNLLTGILGRAQLLRNTTDAGKIREGLEIITKAAQDGAHIVKEIQDYARQRRDQDLSPVAVNQLLLDVVELTRARLEECSLKATAPLHLAITGSSAAYVMGNAIELRRVLVNMIYNAADAMPAGGRIELSAEEQSGLVVIAVSDTGTGMSEETCAHIFDPFFTTKGTKGTGMGMAVSYGIIRRHDGVIEVESGPGKGTVFRIILPVAASIPTVAVEDRKSEPAPLKEATEPAKILVVDDEDCVRELLRETLEGEGCEVVTATGGHEALALFAEREFDGMFTDVNMPDMTGWELARAVRERNRRIPLALITGYGDLVSLEEQRAAEANWVVPKPFDLSRIIEVAQEVVKLRAA